MSADTEPQTVLTPLQAAWAVLDAVLRAALDEVEAFTKTVDAIAADAEQAEARLRGATIHRGPAVLADLLPQVCDILMERTGSVWNFMHQPTKPLARLWSKSGPTLELSVDDMIRPRYVRAHTIWSSSGMTAWRETCFAARLVNSKAEDPYGKVLVSRGADKIAQLIAADVLPRAESLWPDVQRALDQTRAEQEAHEAWAEQIAEALGEPHLKMTTEGNATIRFAAKEPPFIRWQLDLDRHREATFSGAARDVDASHPLIAALAACQVRPEPLRLAA